MEAVSGLVQKEYRKMLAGGSSPHDSLVLSMELERVGSLKALQELVRFMYLGEATFHLNDLIGVSKAVQYLEIT